MKSMCAGPQGMECADVALVAGMFFKQCVVALVAPRRKLEMKPTQTGSQLADIDLQVPRFSDPAGLGELENTSDVEAGGVLPWLHGRFTL